MKITDEMIARYRAKQLEMFGTNQPIDVVRELLEMALNPPVESEIVVTQEMRLAGGDVLTRSRGRMMVTVAGEVYQAMRKLEPISPKLCWSDPVAVCNRRMMDKPTSNVTPAKGETYRSLAGHYVHLRAGDGWYGTQGHTHRRQFDHKPGSPGPKCWPHCRKDNQGPEKGLTYFHKRAGDSAFVVRCHHRKDGSE